MNLHQYLTQKFDSVEGWCSKFIWQGLEYIDIQQNLDGNYGPVCEIGVFKGKFFIGLALMKAAQGRHVVIDVFENQQFNLSPDSRRMRRPECDDLRREFEANVERCGLPLTALQIIQADSCGINATEIRSQIQGFQKFLFFSVDGCHGFVHTYNDIMLATALTHSSGLVIVDDYYNAEWPGVHEAVAKLYFSSVPTFVPLFYSYNKLFLCHVNYHEKYLDGLVAHFKKHHPETRTRFATRYGWQTLTVLPKPTDKILADLTTEQNKSVKAFA